MADDELAQKSDLFPVSTEEVREIFDANLGGQDVGPQDLDVITFPTGGMTRWQIPMLGEEEIKEVIDCVVVHHHTARAYWEDSLEDGGGGNPPDCRSPDGKVGIGNPGGKCPKCPMQEWGPDDEPPECRVMKLIYLMEVNDETGEVEDNIPMILRVPRTSVQEWRNFLLRAARKNIPFYGMVIRFGLEKDQNQDGIEYARLSCNALDVLDEEDRAAAKQRYEMFSKLFSPDEIVEEAVQQ